MQSACDLALLTKRILRRAGEFMDSLNETTKSASSDDVADSCGDQDDRDRSQIDKVFDSKARRRKIQVVDLCRFGILGQRRPVNGCLVSEFVRRGRRMQCRVLWICRYVGHDIGLVGWRIIAGGMPSQWGRVRSQLARLRDDLHHSGEIPSACFTADSSSSRDSEGAIDAAAWSSTPTTSAAVVPG